MSDPFEGWTEEPATAPAAPQPEPAPAAAGFEDWTDEPVAPDKDQAARDRQQMHQRIADAFAPLPGVPGVTSAETRKIATDLGVPLDVVADNLPHFRDTWVAANADPEKWAKDNPLLYKLIAERPDTARAVVRMEKLPALLRAWNWASDPFSDFVATNSGQYAINLGREALKHIPALGPILDPAGSMELPDATGSTETMKKILAHHQRPAEEIAREDAMIRQRLAAEHAQRDEAKPTTYFERLDGKHNVAGVEISKEALGQADAVAGALAFPYPSDLLSGIESYAAAAKQSEISSQYTRLLMARRWNAARDTSFAGELTRSFQAAQEANGPDKGFLSALLNKDRPDIKTAAIEDKIADLRTEARPVLGPNNEAARLLQTVGTTTASSVSGYKWGAAGFALGAGLTYVTKGKSLALAGALGKGAFALQTMDQETGSTYEKLMTTKDETGQQLAEPIAAGGALVAGLLKSAVEMGSLNLELKSMNVGGEITRLAARDMTFRGLLAKVAKARVAVAAEEAGEEAVQGPTDDAVGYFAKAVQQGFFGSENEIGNVLPAVQDAFLGTAAGPLPFMGEAHLAYQVHQHGREVQAAAQVAALTGISSSEEGQSIAEPLAQLIAHDSAANGAPVTHLYVDGVALQKLFQTKGADEDEAMTTLLGEEGPAKLRDAVASGGKVEVPLPVYMDKWGGTDVSKATVFDTTTNAEHQTANQLAGNAEENERLAQQMASTHLEHVKTPEELHFDQLEQQLLDTGKFTPEEAAKKMALWRAMERTAAADFGLPSQQLFGEHEVRIENGDVKIAAPVPSFAQIVARAEKLQDEGRYADALRDDNTGLPNGTHFFALKKPEGMQVAHVSVEGMKYINDNLSHKRGNLLQRTAARALHSAAPGAHIVGGDFAFFVKDQAELDALLAKANEAMAVKGLPLTGRVGVDFDAAKEAHKAEKTRAEDADERARPRPINPDDPTGDKLAAERPRGLDKNLDIKTIDFPTERAPTAYDPSVAAKYKAMSAEEFFLSTYVDPATGAYTGVGWNKISRKAHVAALDVAGLGPIVELYGEAVGDAAVERLAIAANEVGGRDFDFSHLHGDEHAAQANDPLSLELFLHEMERWLQKNPIPWTDPETGEITPLVVKFWHGIGPDLEAADLDLNDRKAALKRAAREAAAKGESADGFGGVPAEERPAAAETQGGGEASSAEVAGGRSGPVGPGDNVGAGAAGDQEVAARAAPAAAENPDRVVDQVQLGLAAIGRMRRPNRALATEFFRYSQGLRKDRPPVTVQMERLLARYGIVDPLNPFRFAEDGSDMAKPLGGKKNKGRRISGEEYRQFRDKMTGSQTSLGPASGGKDYGKLSQEGDAVGPVWHSAVEKSVQAQKQEKNSPSAWLAAIRGTPGVKAEEIEWLGLDDWLAQQKGSVTRAQVLDFVRANKIEVTEETLKGTGAGKMFENGVTSLDLGTKIDEAFPAALYNRDVTPEQANDANMTAAFDLGVQARRQFEHGSIEEAESLLIEAAGLDPHWQGLADLMGEAYFEQTERSERERAAARAGIEAAKYEGYTLGTHRPGSYREITFSTPAAEPYDNPHFGNGVMAHARVSEQRDFAGRKPVLLIEEIQSDLHQEAREKGYRGPLAPSDDPVVQELLRKSQAAAHELHLVAEKLGFGERMAAIFATAEHGDPSTANLGQLNRDYGGGPWPVPMRDAGERYHDAFAAYAKARNALEEKIPDAPFKTTWEEMIAKRMLRLAAEEGFETIAWTTGAQQADRYSLSHHVSKLRYNEPLQAFEALDDDGLPIRGTGKLDVKPEDLPALVGKEAAAKLLAAPDDGGGYGKKGRVLDVAGMTMGGEGMKAAYDQRLPSIFTKMIKKHGGAVAKTTLAGNGGGPGEEVWSVKIPESLRKLVLAEGQPLFATNEQGSIETLKRGTARVMKILLNKDADLSTFLHESAHAFLIIQSDLAARPDAPERVKQNHVAALQAIGVKPRADGTLHYEDATVPQLEKFARSFELYLREGKAPSSALETAFRRFQRWLTSIYKSVASLLKHGAEISPVLSGVFDRILATDAEIAAMSRKMGLDTPPFRSAEEAGLTPEQWAEYLGAQEKATSHATQAANHRQLKAFLAEAEGFLRDELAKERTKAEEAYELLPARRAQLLLRGEQIDGWSGVVEPLDRDAVVEAVGEKAAKKFRTKKGGASPDEIGDVFGYPTGAEMLKAIQVLPAKDVWAAKMADHQMHEKHPEAYVEAAELREEVAKGLHGNYTAEWLQKELRALLSRIGEGKPQMPPIEVTKRAAELIAESKIVGRLGAGAVLVQERAAANGALRAAIAGDFRQAAVFKQQQILNMFLYGALLRAKDERDAFLGFASGLAKIKSQARLGKASAVYRDGVASILEAIGLKRPQPRTSTPSIGDVVKVMISDGATVGGWEDDVGAIVARGAPMSKANPVEFKRLSVKQMRAVNAALKNIDGAARTRMTVIVDHERVADREFVLGELEKTVLPPLPPPPSSSGAATPGQWIAGKWNAFDGSMLRPELMIDWLAGGDLSSMWHKALTLPLQRAKHYEADLIKKVIRPIVEAFEKMPAKVRSRFMQKIDGRKLFPGHAIELRPDIPPPSRRFELIMMALNSGNESNLERLLQGRNITQIELDSALSLLSKEEWDWVQSIWDACEALKPLAFDLEERDSGLRPPEIIAKPVVTKHGTYRGGYFPAVYDRRTPAGARAAASQLADLLDPSLVRPGTPHGHLQSRVDGFTSAISLDVGTIGRHLGQVAHDIAFREAIKSVGGLILDGRVQALLATRLGDERAKQFFQWVKDIGNMRGMDAGGGAAWALSLARDLKANTVIAALGYSIPNAIEDLFTNILSAPSGSELESKHLAAAIAELGGDTAKFAFTPNVKTLAAFDAAEAKSGELRFRRDQIQRDLRKQVASLTAPQGLGLKQFRAVKDHAFAFAEAVDRMTATALWIAANRQATEKGENEQDAVTFADALVRKLLPSHSAVDQAAILRDRGFVGATMLFFGFFNTFYNRQRDIVHSVDTTEGFTHAAGTTIKAGATLVAYAFVVSAIGSLVRGQGPEKDEDWAAWLARKMVFGELSMIPLVGDLLNFIEGTILHKHTQPRPATILAPAFALGEAVLKLKSEDATGLDKVEAMLRALGPMTGLPTTQPIRTGRYGYEALLQHSIPIEGPGDVAAGLVYGQRPNQPWNIPRWRKGNGE